MNGLCQTLITGTMGELIVQARLLQYDVQAAPPLKDSGNDLIAIRGRIFQAIQVKATEGDIYVVPEEEKKYHILAAVKLVGEDREMHFDKCEIFLIEKEKLKNLPRSFSKISSFKLCKKRVDELFPPETEAEPCH